VITVLLKQFKILVIIAIFDLQDVLLYTILSYNINSFFIVLYYRDEKITDEGN
jgi:hypothetical protein